MSGTVAVLGAGAGGTAATIDLSTRRYDVRLWSRSEDTVSRLRDSGGMRDEGVLNARGAITPQTITTDLGEALAGAQVVVVCLPALAHEEVARALAGAACTVPIVLHPGHTGGALHFRRVFAQAGAALPPLAELSTLSYVARKPVPERVTVTLVAKRIWGACLPGGQAALEWAQALFPAVEPAKDVLACDLANVNLVLHAPGAVLAAAWVEATGGEFRFYTDAVTPAVARAIAALDRERLSVAAALGHDIGPLHEEMAAIGTADPDAALRGDLRGAITGGAANRDILAPPSLAHRYYREDFGYGITPLTAFGEIAAVPTPLASALLAVAGVMLGRDLNAEGLTAVRMGIDGLDRDGLLDLVRVGRAE